MFLQVGLNCGGNGASGLQPQKALLCLCIRGRACGFLLLPREVLQSVWPSCGMLYSHSFQVIACSYYCAYRSLPYRDILHIRGKERQYWVVNFFFSLSFQDYPEGNNTSDYLVQTTTYLPQNFTYSPHLPCPEKLPYMRKCDRIPFS